MSKAMDAEIQAAGAIENLEREAALKFGPGVQVTYDAEFPMAKIQADDSENFRFHTGQTVAGITLKSDHRNIAGMADDIRALRQITNPLVLAKRPDGTAHLKQGFRRFNGAKLIQTQEPGSPLANKLMNLPVIIYSGLTAEQEKMLVNDQTAKRFSRAEVFNIYRSQLEGGYHWLDIAARMYHQIAEVTGAGDKAREIDRITDIGKRKDELRKWLNSTLNQGWVSAYKSGSVISDLWLQTYLWQDKYEGVPRPRVVMDSARQKALWTVIQEDMGAGEWDGKAGTGPRTDAKLKEYEDADNASYDTDGTKKRNVDPNAPKLKTLTDVLGLIEQEEKNNNGTPTLLSRLYRITLKGGGDPDATRLIRNFDRCREVFGQHTAYVNEATRKVCEMLLNGVDGAHEEFAGFLVENYADAKEAENAKKKLEESKVVPAPVPETPKTPETPKVEAPPVPVVETPAPKTPETPKEETEGESGTGGKKKAHGKKAHA